MKKVISILLTLLLMVNMVAFAQEDGQNKAVFDLQSLGILQADENGDLRLDSEMTRAEFAAVVVRLLNMEQVADGVKGEQIYADVPAGEWYAPYANLLYHFNIMHGDTQGLFRPEENITQNEVVKVLLCCIGYGAVAYEQGGYPDGYVRMASSLGLYKNVKTENGAMRRRDVAQMVYNTLDVEVMTSRFEINGVAKYEISEDETLRSHLGDKFSGKGTVTANSASYLNSPVSGLEADEVVIDEQVYKVGTTNAAQLLGRKVEFYAEWDDGREEVTLISIRPDKTVKEVEVEAEDVLELSLSKLVYTDADGKKVTEPIKENASVLKNGYLLMDASEELTLADGYLTAIDNGSGVIDTLFIQEYINGKVKLVLENSVYFEDPIYDSVKFVELDPENKDLKFSIRGADGNAMKTEDIQPDDIVSVFRSRDGGVVDLIVSRNLVQGTVDAIDEDYVTIDGEAYKYSDECTFKPGEEVEVYIDYRGKIFQSEVKALGQVSYGYVIEYAYTSFKASVKMILPGDFKEEMVSNMDEENPIETAVLRGKNKGVETYDLSDKLTVTDENGNSRKMGAAELGTFFGPAHNGTLVSSRVVKFKLDAQDRIKSLELPQRIYNSAVGVDATKTYNSYEKVFAKSGNTPFGADEGTKVLCVPDKEGIRVDEDYNVTIDLKNGSKYTVSGFDQDEKTEVADLIVITTTMDSSTAGVIDDKSPFGVINKVTTVWDEAANESIYELSIYAEGRLQKRRVADLDEVKRLAGQLKRGDVIYFSDDADKNINKIKFIEGLDQLDQVYSEGSSSNEQRLFGRVSAVDFDEINDVLGRRVNVVTAVTDEAVGSTQEVLLNTRNPLPLYLYDRDADTISIIRPEEIKQNGEDKIFAHIVNYKLMCAVVVRGK